MPFSLAFSNIEAFDPALHQKLLGVAVPLRHALDAQNAGAQSIVCTDPKIRPLLEDSRLTIPVVSQRPSGIDLVHAPVDWVFHRGYLAAARKARPTGDFELKAGLVDLGLEYGFEPIQVTDKAGKSRAASALMRSLRKPQDGWTSTALNRPISLFLSRGLVATPLKPNQVSIGILAIGIAGAVLASYGDYWHLLAGAVCFHSQSVLDGCDGEMSRITYRVSHMGQWLDTVGDDITNYGYFGAAGYGIYRQTQNPLYLVAGATVVLCGIVVSAIQYHYLVKIGSGDLLKYPIGVGRGRPGAEAEKTGLAKLADNISPIFKRDTFVFLTLIAAALGVVHIALAIFAIGAIGIFIATMKAELRMAKEGSRPK